MNKTWLTYGMPVDGSVDGWRIDSLIAWVHLLMLVLFIGWLGYFIYVLIRFRQKKNPKADHVGVTSQASTYVEGAVALIEAALLIGLAIPIWARTVDKFPSESESTVVRVAGQQFAWNIRYPGPDGKFAQQDPKFITSENKFGVDPADPNGKDDILLVNDLTVPVNKPVLIHLTSMDVIHSFGVRGLRAIQDAIPGMMIPMHFTPSKTGEYWVTCAQLCGQGHYSMKGKVTVLSQDDFTQWLTKKSQAGASDLE